jgi:hypothetical protein
MHIFRRLITIHHFGTLSDANVASTSQVRASAMLSLLIVGNRILRGWNVPQWHVHRKFHENRSTGTTL